MSTINDDTSFLDDALAFASIEQRYHVADALACHLHNDGYALQGNTEASDVDWFARNIFERDPVQRSSWERAASDVQETFREIARVVIAALPAYQMRVAHRLITLSKVVRDIERAERKQHEAAKRRRRVIPTPSPLVKASFATSDSLGSRPTEEH
jgi:hypothetical protein